MRNTCGNALRRGDLGDYLLDLLDRRCARRTSDGVVKGRERINARAQRTEVLEVRRRFDAGTTSLWPWGLDDGQLRFCRKNPLSVLERDSVDQLVPKRGSRARHSCGNSRLDGLPSFDVSTIHVVDCEILIGERSVVNDLRFVDGDGTDTELSDQSFRLT
jgi:hypothetical protein